MRLPVTPTPAPTRRALLVSAAALFTAPAHAAAPRPMLAGLYRPGLVLADYWVSEKYDGVRALWDGRALFTRQGHRIQAPAWFTHGWPHEPLDGELWAGHGRFERAASAAARDQPLDAAWQGLRYMVFDLPAQGGAFDARLQRLRALPTGLATLQVVAQRKVESEAQLQALLAATVRAGGEGLMLRRGDSPYRPGERSDDLLKLKPHQDAEATVIGHLPGQGRHAGRMGALVVRTPDGVTFRLGTGFSDAERDAPPPPGSVVTYRYRGLHPGGAPRFASYLRVRRD